MWHISGVCQYFERCPKISQYVNYVVISHRQPMDILNLKYKNKDIPETMYVEKFLNPGYIWYIISFIQRY